MKIPRYIVIKLEMVGKDTVKATEITDRCEVYEYEADEDEPQTDEWHDDCNTCMWYDGACTIPCCDYEPKTENCSEKPNNSTISKMEQVETMSCAECKHRPIGAEICEEPCHYEPQTDWHYDEQDATWYPYKHEDEPQTNADQHVQHVGSVETMSCQECKHFHENAVMYLDQCDFCFKDCKYEPKDEPFDKDINVRSKTENNSEKPNNCEHITEDGVTCAKYPACDDCIDNPLNKVKGSERLVKGVGNSDRFRKE